MADDDDDDGGDNGKPYYSFEMTEDDRQTLAETQHDLHRGDRLKKRIEESGLSDYYRIRVEDMFRVGQKYWRIPLTLNSDSKRVDERHFVLMRKLGVRLVVEEIFNENAAFALTLELRQTRFFFHNWSVRDYVVLTAGILGSLWSSYHCTQHVLPLFSHLLAA
jgi:hypothetical protein